MKRLTFLLIVIVLFLISSVAYAQDTIRISGIITDQFNNPLQEAYIKFSTVETEKTVLYSFLGKSNQFSIQIPAIADQNYQLIIGRSGYRDTIIGLNASKREINLKVTLSPVGLTLGGVTIETPPIYEKGDTTFHKVSAFASGVEQNLGELIQKIPGFSITGDGTLLFKNKIVEKVLVQGEDLFSDKQSLLLQNFPPDVIENIQALENQTENLLLKGLETGNKTWVNLSLKKEKIRALGFFDAGLNSNGKYLLSPLLFSILKKTKLAVIGNYNNQGVGSSILQHYELKSPLTRWNERWLSPLPYFEQIGELQSEHFLQNNIRDTRMKLNSSFGKKVKSQTEFSWLADRWRLDKYAEQFIEADSSIQHKLENAQSEIKPEKISLQQKLDWSLNNRSELKLSFLAFHDRTNVNARRNQELETIPDSLNTALHLRNISYSLSTKYTNRINEKSAIVLELQMEKIRTRQSDHYITDRLGEMITGLENHYNALQLSKVIISENISGKLTFLTKPGKQRISPYINFENRSVNVDNEFSYGNKFNQIPDSIAQDFPEHLKMDYTKIETGMGYGGGKKLLWNISGTAGVYQPGRSVTLHKKLSTAFIGNLSGNFKFNRNRYRHNFSLSLSRHPMHLQEIFPLNFPKSPVQSFTYSTENNTNSSLYVNYYLTKTFRNKHALSLMLNHNTRFGNFAYSGSLNRIFQHTQYVFKHHPLSNQSLLLSYYFPLIKRSYVEFSFNFSRMGSLVKRGEDIFTANYNQFTWEVEAEKRWKNHELKLSGKYFTLQSGAGRSSNNKSITSGVHQFNAESSYLIRVGKSWSVENQIQYFKTTSFGQEKSDLLFAHSAVHYIKKNARWRLTAFLNNLTNVRSYQSIWSSFPITGSTIIPITKRNIAIKLRYNL